MTNIANIAGGFMQGFQQGTQINKLQAQNAEAQRGAQFNNALAADPALLNGIISGDPGAYNAFAKTDPMRAYGLREKVRGDQRAAQMHEVDVEKVRAETGAAHAQAAKHGAEAAQTMDETSRVREVAALQSIMQIGAAAYKQGPEAWARAVQMYSQELVDAGLNPENFTFDNAHIVLGRVSGLAEGLQNRTDLSASDYMAGLQGEEQFNKDRYKVVGNSLFDLGAEGGPAVVGSGEGQQKVIRDPATGNIIYQEGALDGVKFSEQQSKDNVYATRARGALETLDPIAGKLASIPNRAANLDPTGLSRSLQSDDFQVAEQAGTEFLQAILRKDTGAAITRDETESYGRVYLPQVGDGPAVLEAKREARIRAINALESGMSPLQILARDRALVAAAEEAGQGDGGERKKLRASAAPQGQPGQQPTQRFIESIGDADEAADLWQYMDDVGRSVFQ